MSALFFRILTFVLGTQHQKEVELFHLIITEFTKISNLLSVRDSRAVLGKLLEKSYQLLVEKVIILLY